MAVLRSQRQISETEFENTFSVLFRQTREYSLAVPRRRQRWLCKEQLPDLPSTKRIELFERGKRREIVPITIHDRMIQRVLCDYALVPRLQPTLIDDNGASMKGKGVEFTPQRAGKHLRKAIREYGTNSSRNGAYAPQAQKVQASCGRR